MIETKTKNMFLIQIITICMLSLAEIDAGVLHVSTLPGNIMPIHYKFHLTVTYANLFNHSESTYSANVEIHLKVIKRCVKSIILHAEDPKYMKYQEVVVHYPNGTKEQLKVGEYVKANETQEFTASNILPANQLLRLFIKFTNRFSYREGIFRIIPSRGDHNRQFRGYFIFTHGQPDHARKMFPCFDEPAFKATFEISVSISDTLVDKGYNVLSNTEIEKESHGDNMTTFIFSKTPVPMSTYLVAISITTFNHTLIAKFNSSYPNIDSNNFKLLRTIGPKSMLQLENVRKMHIIAKGMLEAFTRRFKVGYALPKLDQIFAEDFAYNGMENFGLIFYKLQKFKRTDILEMSYIEAHEIAHQWFGNLVTVKGWTDFWIQEGFAHYYGTMVLDEVKVNGMPAGYYDFLTNFVIDNLLPALKTDSYDNAPPVKDSVKHLFGGAYVLFTYNKAATLIRMLKLSYGTEVFDKAMQLYFKLFKEQNANSTDLIHCFDLAFKKPRPDSKIRKPSEIKFENWINQKGYPLVEVLPPPWPQPNAYMLTQRRFIHRNITKEPFEDHKWFIPITYSTSENQNFENTEAIDFMSFNRSITTIINLPRKVDWIILNHQIAGFYRVNYQTKNWKAIIKVLNDKNKFEIIHELNRAQLVDDSLTLATTEKNYYNLPLPSLTLVIKLYKYLEHENKYYPWKAAIERFISVDVNWCRDITGCPEFKTDFHAIITKKYNELKNKPSENMKYHEKKLQELITNYYCKNINVSCRGKPNKTFYDKLISGDIDHLDLSDFDDVHCCNIIRQGSQENWDNLWTTYLKLRDQNLKKKVLRCLACANNKDTINKYLGKVLDKNLPLENWERTEIFHYITDSRPENAKLALQFLMSNYQAISETFNGNLPRIDFFEKLSKNLQSYEDVAQIGKFFKEVENGKSSILKKIYERALTV